MARPERDDKLLVRYLLGELPDEKSADLERAALEGGDVFEQLRAVEDDLVDAYARGEFSERERRRFEARFLATAEGRGRVAAARSFLTAVDRRPASALPAGASSGESVWRRFLRFLAPSRPVGRWAWAAIFTLALGLAWLGRDALLPFRAAPETVTFLLASGNRAPESLPRLVLPPTAATVELQIDLGAAEPPRLFRVRLHSSQDSRQILRSEGLRAQATAWGHALTLEVPANLLPPGRYLLGIDGLGPSSEYIEFDLYELEVVSESSR